MRIANAMLLSALTFCLLSKGAFSETRKLSSSPFQSFGLTFEKNVGQFPDRAQYFARASDYQLLVSPAEAITRFAPNQKGGTSEVRMQIIGGSPQALITGSHRLPLVTNYYLSDDKSRWHTGVPHYERIDVKDIYPGVQLSYYGNDNQVEYEFLVQPGVDPNIIRVKFGGVQTIAVDPEGALVLKTATGEIRHHKPMVYEMDSPTSRGQTIEGRYVLRGSHEIGFHLAAHNPKKPVLIDPIIERGAYIGGDGNEEVYALAEGNGELYATGYTNKIWLGPNASSTATTPQVFVAKLGSDSGNYYITFLAGSSEEFAYDIKVDLLGNAIVVGETKSSDFPRVAAFQDRRGINYENAFVTKLDPAGAIVYSSFFGDEDTHGSGIAIDNDGNAYITGRSARAIPEVVGSYRRKYGTGAFVAKISPAGGLVYSASLGGGVGNSIAVDNQGRAHIVGRVGHDDLEIVSSPTSGSVIFNSSIASGPFFAVLNPEGTALVASSFLTDGPGDITSCAIDQDGNLTFAGKIFGNGLPTGAGTNPADQPTNNGDHDAFVGKTGRLLGGLVFLSYLGGSNAEGATRLSVDSANSIYVLGATQSTHTGWPAADAVLFPATDDSFTDMGGMNRGGTYIAKFSPAGQRLYSSVLTYYNSWWEGQFGGGQIKRTQKGLLGIGGWGDHGPHGLAVFNKAAIIGGTINARIDSLDFSTVAWGGQLDYAGGRDGFIVKANLGPSGQPTVSRGTVTSDSIAIYWEYLGLGATSFRVERALANASGEAGTFETVATLPASITNYVDRGLQIAQRYFYRVFALNEHGDSDPSAVVDVTTIIPPTPTPTRVPPTPTATATATPAPTATPTPAPDTAAPTISNVVVVATSITRNTATITWTTNEPADSKVLYGTSVKATSLWQVMPLDTTATTTHSVTITGLMPNKLYYYQVESADAAGNTARRPAVRSTSVKFKTKR